MLLDIPGIVQTIFVNIFSRRWNSLTFHFIFVVIGYANKNYMIAIIYHRNTKLRRQYNIAAIFNYSKSKENSIVRQYYRQWINLKQNRTHFEI